MTTANQDTRASKGTETNSPIESGIEKQWSKYSYVDDSEHAIVVGVEWVDDTTTTKLRYAIYACEAGLVEQIQSPQVVEFERVNNLSDAAVRIRDEIESCTVEDAQEYWR